MSAYIAGLRAAAERASAEAQQIRDQQHRAEIDAARLRLTPLEDRLARLLATIPIGLQREGLALESLQVQLRGRKGGVAHCGEIGAALRQLGFERRRSWRGSEGFRAVWRKKQDP